MKKLFLTLLLGGLISVVQAQHVRLGVKAGLNVAELVNKFYNTYGKPGFVGGLQADCKLSEVVSIQPELLYSQQGYALSSGGGFGNLGGGRSYYKLDYLQLPVLAKVTLRGVFVEGGPQVGLLLNRTLEAQKRLDFSAALGAGYQFANGLNAGARYTRSLIPINEDYNYFGNMETFKDYHQVFQFSVGYLFGSR